MVMAVIGVDDVKKEYGWSTLKTRIYFFNPRR